ncbi:MAG: GNAT family protein [Chloroflexota bacterium]
MILLLKGTNTIVGPSGLHRINWAVPGLRSATGANSIRRAGVCAIEAVQGITRFGFETPCANRMEIRCDSRNERSAAVACRAGYTLEATLHADDRHHLTVSFGDTFVFAMLRQNMRRRGE